jgi:hypothetical protein
MIDIYLPTVRLELKNNKIYDYLEAMGMEYEFLPYSDFDFILNKKQISELIDYIITTDGNRDVEMVETLTMTLTEMTLNKIKYAEFHIRWEKK